MKGPRRITFDTNPDSCNLHCKMCELHSNYNKNYKKSRATTRPRIMPFEIIKKVIESAAPHGLEEIIPSTMGEPLLYPKFNEIISLVKKYSLKLNLTTNGTFPGMTATEWGRLILPVASDVKISINGATRNVSESIMQGLNFNRQIRNIQEFISVRDEIREMGINDPTVTFQVTYMESNLAELPELLKLAIKMGADRLKGHHLWVTHPELAGESLRRDADSIRRWNETVDILNKIQEENPLKNGKKIILDNVLKLENDVNRPVPSDFTCPFLGREAWIAWDGTFNICCAPDYLRKQFGNFGNVNDHDFMELWTSQKYQKMVL
ncbi:MAG: radical SAM protein, partial [Promethearchaeota archaeon]